MSNNNGPYLEILDWDKLCKTDFRLKRGFEISEPPTSKKKEKSHNPNEEGVRMRNVKSYNGIWSQRFCSDWSDENAFEERYSCRCGDLRGKIYEGETCPICNTKIEFRGVDLNIRGWIILHDYKVIHPMYYKKLASVIGESKFSKIIKYEKVINRNGYIEDKEAEKGDGPFAYIGLLEFRERFDEILEYYKQKNKKNPVKLERIEEIERDRKKVFTSCIPVISSVLRSSSFRNDTLFYTDIDKYYSSMYNMVNLLNDTEEYERRKKQWKANKKGKRMDIPTIITTVQNQLMTIHKLIFDCIDGKEGQVKGEILGGMINFSSRCVIIPDPVLKSNEIFLNYSAFHELFKYEIIACLVKMHGVSKTEANKMWHDAKIEKSKKMFEVMRYINQTPRRVYINRNPSINYGSILCMKIKDIKFDFKEDYTMSIPIQVLPVMNADFDGDILNIVSLKTKDIAKAFKKGLDPSKTMFISRNDAKFNNDFNLYKDQIIGLYEFNNIDTDNTDEEFPKHLQDIVNELSNQCFIIDKEMESMKRYKEFFNRFYKYITDGFEHRELRCCNVYFRFHEDDEIHVMELRHFVTHLLLWKPMIKLGAVDELNGSYIMDLTLLTSDYLREFIDRKIVIPYREVVSNKKLNTVVSSLIYDLSKIPTDFNIILGLSINMESFIDVANKNERFNEIIRTKLDESMQPSEIEDRLHKLEKEEIEILSTEENCLRPMLRANAGIKHKQLAELSISGGLKPSLEGMTIPVPINSNYIMEGLNNVKDYYIDAIGGRKALVMAKMKMGTSGYFSRKNSLLASSVDLRKDDEICDTLHPIEFEIKTKKHLERLVGRYYKMYGWRNYKIIGEDDTHLIGKKILVRSPISCASKDGICKACYGNVLFKTNQKHITAGAYAAAVVTNPISQSVLSAKHLLTTTSETIKFPKIFDKFFTLTANEVMINNEDDVNLEDYSIIVIGDNIVKGDELEYGELSTFIKLFNVIDHKTGEVYEIMEEGKKDLYIDPEFMELLGINKKKRKTYEIKLSDIPDEMTLFLLAIGNSELTKPLYDIMGLLDHKSKREELGIETMHDLAQAMLDLTIESKINIQSVHEEMLLYPLIRSNHNILERPDFSKYDAESDTQLVTVSHALEKHPSVLIGLSSQYLDRQLINPLTVKRRSKSYVDSHFKLKP